MSIESFLKTFPIFSDLTAGEFVNVATVFFHKDFDKGECLLREGEISPQLILVESGEAQVYKGLGRGGKVIGEVHGGDALGELTVFGTEAHGATVVASTQISAYVALGPDLLALVQKGVSGIAKVLRRMMELAVARCRRAEDRAQMASGAGLLEPTIEGRLMHAIQHSELIRVSFYAGQEKEVEGAFRLIDISSELGVPLIRLAMDLEARTLHGKEIRMKEYVVPLSGLHFLSFDSIART